MTATFCFLIPEPSIFWKLVKVFTLTLLLGIIVLVIIILVIIVTDALAHVVIATLTFLTLPPALSSLDSDLSVTECSPLSPALLSNSGVSPLTWTGAKIIPADMSCVTPEPCTESGQ